MSKNLKYILAILFFPFTLTYLIWKQTWSTKAKVIATFALWVVFVGIGSSGGNAGNGGSVQSGPTASPRQEEQKPTYTLEQKQEDFKKLYVDYQKKGQALILIKVAMASMQGSREELYLALDKVSGLLESVASFDNSIEVPESLKENKDIGKASLYLSLTATAYKSAVEDLQDYLNKGDLNALKKARSNSERGDQNLLTSKDAIDNVARELGVDTTQIKVEE